MHFPSYRQAYAVPRDERVADVARLSGSLLDPSACGLLAAMTKVLVTGGAGFIGSHLVERLLTDGHDVVIVDNLCSGSRENLASAPGARLIVADILDLLGLADALSDVERIFHLAALISGPESLREPERYFETNLNGTARVIQLAAKIGARRIVFASSSTVYGNAGPPLKHENLLPAPLSVYALTKLAGEHLLRQYAPLTGYSHVALRLFNVYGPRQTPNHPYANVTCKFAHAAAHRLPIEVFGDGEQARDFVYVEDVVRAFVAVAEAAEHSHYNVGSGTSCSINDLVALTEHASGQSLARRNCPAWPNDIRDIRADVALLQRTHGYLPGVSLEAGINRTLEYFRKSLAQGL